MDDTISKNSRIKHLETAAVIALGFLALAYLFQRAELAAAAFSVLILSVFSKFLGRIIHEIWMGLSGFLGIVSSWILLFLIFYLVLTPIALLRKLLNSRSNATSDKKRASSFQTVDRSFEPGDFKKMW